MKIANCVALVTGANRGIGRSLVPALLAGGAARVYATARTPQALAELAKLDRDRVVPLELDVTSAHSIEAAVKSAPDVSLLVNNAGVLSSFNILASSRAQLEQDFATNFFGPLAVTKAFLPALEQEKPAAIANLLTVVSFASRPVIGGYAASKAAARSMTQSLRAELAPKGISVHGIVPGAVDTDMIRAFPIAKTSPDEVAKRIVDGLDRGEEDIITDPFAREAFDRWLANPKDFERYFGSL